MVKIKIINTENEGGAYSDNFTGELVF